MVDKRGALEHTESCAPGPDRALLCPGSRLQHGRDLLSRGASNLPTTDFRPSNTPAAVPSLLSRPSIARPRENELPEENGPQPASRRRPPPASSPPGLVGRPRIATRHWPSAVSSPGDGPQLFGMVRPPSGTTHGHPAARCACPREHVTDC